MQNIKLQVIAKISLLILLYILVYYTFSAFISKPMDGDSLDYHIPIAKMIVQGSIFDSTLLSHVNQMRYSPGSSEAILSLFVLLHLPLNLFNVFGLLILFIVLFYLSLGLGLQKSNALIFAATFCTIHGVVRWLVAQTIDIWLAVFFTATLILLQKPEKKLSYFFNLGFTAGMLVGTKYTGPIFLLIMSIFYIKSIVKNINFSRFLAFFIPFTLFGLLWYIRNYVFTHDPYFPQSIPFFKGMEWHIFDWAVWKIIFLYPTGFIRTLNAFVSEYTIWCLSVPLSILFLLFGKTRLKKEKYTKIAKLIILGLINFIVYFFMPSGPHDNLMVTGFRYTYPAFIPLILSIFLIAEEFGKSEFLSIISVINMIMLTEMSYHPKILLLFIPVGITIYFLNFNQIWRKIYRFVPLRIQLFYQKKK